MRAILLEAQQLTTSPNELLGTLLLDAATFVVEQTDIQISSHQDSAYSYALLCVVSRQRTQFSSVASIHTALLLPEKLVQQSFSAFGDILLAVLYKASVYTAPLYLARDRFASDADFRRAEGYRISSPDSAESEEEFVARSQGAVALLAALSEDGPVPFGPGLGWRWLARVANRRPRRVTAGLLYTFLDVACYRLQQRYGRQLRKLMRALREQLLPRLPEGTAPAARGRLEMFLDSYERLGGQLPEPDGRRF